MKNRISKLVTLSILFFSLLVSYAQEPEAKTPESSGPSPAMQRRAELEAHYREQFEAQVALPDEEAPLDELNRRKAVLELQQQQLQLEQEKSKKWLPVIMPFAAFFFVLAILGIIFGYERKKDQNRHETIRIYLEKGIEVPAELLIDEDHPHAKQSTSDLRKGIIWSVVGIGISITALIILGSDRGAAIGLIPICIGIGYLVAAKLDPKPARGEE